GSALLDGIPAQTGAEIGDVRNLLIGAGANPALQRGERNSASLTLMGEGGVLQILQQNMENVAEPVPGLLGNTATMTAGAGALGAVIQLGDNNLATLNLGAASAGLIAQNGTNLI